MSETPAADDEATVFIDFLQICGVDFNLLHILDNVFEYLTEKELTAVFCVNKTWSTVVKKTRVANQRREKYLNDIRKLKETVGEENWPIKHPPIEPRLQDPRLAFTDIKNTRKKVKQTETPSNFVGSQSAAVISTHTTTLRRKMRLKRAIFTPMRQCDADCVPKRIENSTYLFPEDSPVKDVVLGSKQSKRNLKRL